MREKETPIRVEEDDPTRCHSSAYGQQCRFKSTEDSVYCTMHGGSAGIERTSNQVYQLKETEYHRRVAAGISRFADSEKKRDISQEIGILRITLEEMINKDENALSLYSTQINQLILNINKLVNDSLKIEKEIGQLLDRSQVAQIATELVNDVAEEIDDPHILQRIAERFEKTIERH